MTGQVSGSTAERGESRAQAMAAQRSCRSLAGVSSGARVPAAARKSARARARGTASLSEEHSLAKGGFGAIRFGCLAGGGEAAGGFDGQRYSEEVEVGEQVSERRTGGAMSEVGCVDNDDRLEVTRAERVVILSAKIGQMVMGSR